MRKVVYVGGKPVKADNVAGTGLTWARGEIHDIVDDKAADKLLEHKGVWADANYDYKLAEPEAVKTTSVPRLNIVPQDSKDLHWEPITIAVPEEVFSALQSKEIITVFIKPDEADAYSAWKAEQSDEFDPETADKRSRAYRDWAAANPDKAQKVA